MFIASKAQLSLDFSQETKNKSSKTESAKKTKVLNNVKFFIKTEIEGDIPQAKKDEIIERVKRCPVCRILRSEKEFLDLKDIE